MRSLILAILPGLILISLPLTTTVEAQAFGQPTATQGTGGTSSQSTGTSEAEEQSTLERVGHVYHGGKKVKDSLEEYPSFGVLFGVSVGLNLDFINPDGIGPDDPLINNGTEVTGYGPFAGLGLALAVAPIGSLRLGVGMEFDLLATIYNYDSSASGDSDILSSFGSQFHLEVFADFSRKYRVGLHIGARAIAGDDSLLVGPDASIVGGDRSYGYLDLVGGFWFNRFTLLEAAVKLPTNSEDHSWSLFFTFRFLLGDFGNVGGVIEGAREIDYGIRG